MPDYVDADFFVFDRLKVLAIYVKSKVIDAKSDGMLVEEATIVAAIQGEAVNTNEHI